MKTLLLALTIFTICALPTASARSDDALTFELGFGDQGHHIVNPVDYLTWCGDCVDADYHAGTPWVTNPGTTWPFELPATAESGCLWDSDDFFSYVSRGSVFAAGVSITLRECRYAGFVGAPYSYIGVNVRSSSPDLRVTERWTWAGGSVSTSTMPFFETKTHLWRYFDCIQGPFAQAPLVTIPGSNGGQALPQLITLTVSNPTTRKATKTYGVISSNYSHGEIQNFGCLTFRVP